MRSGDRDLESRGFLKEGEEVAFVNFTNSQKLKLLKSPIPKERTLGARLAGDIGAPAVLDLIDALKVEKKLYPKIEISNTLVALGEASVKPLIAELGRIGNNQHKGLPNKGFEKDSYPLPRDISARTLAHIGKQALPDLLAVLVEDHLSRLTEAIDAIGFICFYDYQPDVSPKLIDCYSINARNDLICWKLIRAMSGLPESLSFLMENLEISQNPIIKSEIKRSIRLINKRKDFI